ncbi:glycosyltransferase family 39 protein [Dermatobacter hominis]|uniref:glycosyltransferase family 39 protein n=1 Tax=Dermatobacter hominis TaxID=2884263 RepID=UPI001D101144|nr:glycosyltransferase family 39 protein [Dermatobacter hominis]UDY34109.1 glycosyltransferase family 39 protein [Dermatobacter hominis]
MGGATARGAKVSVAALGLAVLLVVVVCIPRFATYKAIDPSDVALTPQPNGWFLELDDGSSVGRYSFDNYSYIAYVDEFRGDFDRYPIYGPWIWRLLPSWLAAQTPIENPAVALAAVSLAFLVLGAVALVATSARNGLDRRGQMLVGALYAVSFPMVWYGTSGYVDGPLMATLCMGLFAIQSRRWWLYFLLLPIGFLVKETYILIVPVAVTYQWVRARRTQDWVPTLVGSLVLVAFLWFGIRWMLPTPRTLDWIPRLPRFLWNLSRPEAVGSFLLSCGVVVPCALLEIRRRWRARSTDGATEDLSTDAPAPDADGDAAWREELHLVVGLVMGMLVAIHGFLTAYADGRHAWTMYPFGVILAAIYLQRRLGSTADAPSPAVDGSTPA